MKVRIAVLLSILVAAMALGCPVSPACPVHQGATGYFVRYEMIDGAQLGVYHCYRGHDFMVRCN